MKDTIEIDENSSPFLSIKMIEKFPKDNEVKAKAKANANADDEEEEKKGDANKKEGKILNVFFKYDASIAE